MSGNNKQDNSKGTAEKRDNGYKQFVKQYKDLKQTFLRGGDIFKTSTSNFNIPIVKAYLSNVESLRVLDAGSGCGRPSLESYGKRKANLVLIDIIPEAIELARMLYTKNNCDDTTGLIVGDITKLPFNDESFDVVHSAGVIEHFGDTSSPLKEYARVLRSNGLAIVSVPNVFSWFAFYSRVLFPAYCFIRGKRQELAEHVEKSFTASSFRSILNQHHFEIVDLIPIMLFTTLLPLRRLPLIRYHVFRRKRLIRPFFNLFYWLAKLTPAINLGFSFLYAIAKKDESAGSMRLVGKTRNQLLKELKEIDIAYLYSFQT